MHYVLLKMNMNIERISLRFMIVRPDGSGKELKGKTRIKYKIAL